MRTEVRHSGAFSVGCAVLLAAAHCFNTVAAASGSTNEPRHFSSVRSISLPHFEPDLPVAAGRDEFMVVCASCHSPRYVTMQPLFPRRQWEETVDKMVKVYGAEMDQRQRQLIVEYLVTMHGPNSTTTRAGARDDDVDFTSPPKPGARAETAPFLKLAADGTDRLKEVIHGAELFKQDCGACHGTEGRGDGWVGQVLLRKPKDLSATLYSMRFLSQVLWNGKRGTAMPSWRALPQSDLAALAAYVRTVHHPSRVDTAPAEALKNGSQVFPQNCAPCHGASGDGTGAAATSLIPEPANFKLKQPDFGYILQVVSDGIPGTAMPAWKNQISETDRRALADFVRSLFDAASDDHCSA
jgi:mono/diheme cytochrome c family protein